MFDAIFGSIQSMLGTLASAAVTTNGTDGTVLTQTIAPESSVISSADDLIPVIAVGGGLFIAFVAILSSTIAGVARRKAFEESRREIAAYVAEGSVSPADAERMLNAGKKDD